MTLAQYGVTFGLSGCYLPDSGPDLVECTTRRALAASIRDYLELYEMPASLFNEVKITRLWQFIVRNGSSSAHFNLHHKNNVLSFNGLTHGEAIQLRNEEGA